MAHFGISWIAQASGCAVQTVRYYEEIGLLPRPARSSGNTRRYGEAELNRLRFIRHARELGFEIPDIRELLRLAAHADAPCADADAIARRQLDAVNERMRQLQRLRTEIKRMIDACHGGPIAACKVLEGLGDHSSCDVGCNNTRRTPHPPRRSQNDT